MKIRIVNRYRFIGFIAAVILLFAVILSGSFLSASAMEQPGRECLEITVGEGDTIWQLAKCYACENKDIRRAVFDICRLNGIEDALIVPGQTLLIPLK